MEVGAPTAIPGAPALPARPPAAHPAARPGPAVRVHVCARVCGVLCGVVGLVLRHPERGPACQRSQFVSLNSTTTDRPWEASQPAGKGCTCFLSQGARASGRLDPASSSP